MKPRVRELALQAGAGEWGDTVVPAMMDIEKFADLIAGELSMNDRYETLRNAVIAWANARGIIETSDPKTQMLKCVSEIGELADNVAKGDNNSARDDIGDVLVTLILLAKLLDVDLLDCLEEAYDVIKKRSGRMVNGVFVKDMV